MTKERYEYLCAQYNLRYKSIFYIDGCNIPDEVLEVKFSLAAALSSYKLMHESQMTREFFGSTEILFELCESGMSQTEIKDKMSAATGFLIYLGNEIEVIRYNPNNMITQMTYAISDPEIVSKVKQFLAI